MGFERVLIPVGVVLLLAALILLLAWLFQRSLIYFPSSGRTVAGGDSAARRRSRDLRDRRRAYAGGLVPAARPTTPAKTGKARAVLVFNGNAGDREMRAPLAIALADAGLAVLLFDYRGYGGNPGSPSEDGLVADARAAVKYLAGREDVDPGQIVYFGESLGAAVAVAMAAERPPAALILRSPLTSLADMAKVHYPFLPAGLLLKDRFDSIDTIHAIGSPLLVIVGENDRIVPAEQSRRLYEAATGPAQFLQIDGAGHNDYEFLAGERFIRAIVDFLDTTLQPD
jgi:fermentation-respiration switch protein FrsA (DUF1100 family)